MSEYSRRIIPVVVATLLVTTLAAYEVNNLYSTTSTTSTTSQANETVEGNALGGDGLQLFVSLNASQLTPGQALQVNLSIINTLPTTNGLPVEDGFLFQGVPLSIWPDCDEAILGSSSVGFNASAGAEAVVLAGDYGINNITSVADIHFPVFGCTTGGIRVDRVAFGPGSALANLTDQSINATRGPYNMTGSFITNGYWNMLNNSKQAAVYLNYEGQHTIDSPLATPFTPGAYTVAVEDVWGQVVTLHFMVK